MGDAELLCASLKSADALIVYQPLVGEPDFNTFLELHAIEVPRQKVPRERATDAVVIAEQMSLALKGSRVAVLAPGSAFDAIGTRHGRGGGWYDRFFSKVPVEWVRVGVATGEQFHTEPISRYEWDEPMDYVLIQDISWKVVKTPGRGI